MDMTMLSRSCSFLDEPRGLPTAWSPARWYRAEAEHGVAQSGSVPGRPDLDVLFTRLLGDALSPASTGGDEARPSLRLGPTEDDGGLLEAVGRVLEAD